MKVYKYIYLILLLDILSGCGRRGNVSDDILRSNIVETAIGYKSDDVKLAESAIIHHVSFLNKLKESDYKSSDLDILLAAAYGKLMLIEIHNGDLVGVTNAHRLALDALNLSRRARGSPTIEMSIDQFANSMRQLEEVSPPKWKNKTKE